MDQSCFMILLPMFNRYTICAVLRETIYNKWNIKHLSANQGEDSWKWHNSSIRNLKKYMLSLFCIYIKDFNVFDICYAYNWTLILFLTLRYHHLWQERLQLEWKLSPLGIDTVMDKWLHSMLLERDVADFCRRWGVGAL